MNICKVIININSKSIMQAHYILLVCADILYFSIFKNI